MGVVAVAVVVAGEVDGGVVSADGQGIVVAFVVRVVEPKRRLADSGNYSQNKHYAWTRFQLKTARWC